MFPSPSAACNLALSFLRIPVKNKSREWLDGTFKKYFGSSPTVLVSLWIDLWGNVEMIREERSEKDFWMFLIANFLFLSTPKML